MSSRLTTNAGGSLTSTDDFLIALLTANAVASVASSVCSARMISSSGRIATGLKKWNPTTRSGCSRPDAISVIDNDDVLVARTASGLDVLLDLGEDLLLDLDLLEHGLDHEVGVGERVLGQRAGDQGLEPVGLVGADPALGQLLVEFVVDVGDPLSSRSWSRSVMTTGTSSCRANSRAS